MQQYSKFFAHLLYKDPQAIATVRGSDRYPDITGTVKFYQIRGGVLVAAEIFGLPTSDEQCKSPVFGFHIHSGNACTGNADDPFINAHMHYDLHGCPHPYHAGDLPPLFGVNGYAFSAFVTGRFSVREIVGKTVIIHANPDDFTTQPAGNAGAKIACGEIAMYDD